MTRPAPKSHKDHQDALADLQKKATAAGLHGLADLAGASIAASVAASAAYSNGTSHQQIGATAALLGSTISIMTSAAQVPTLPADVDAAGRKSLKELGQALIDSSDP